MQCVTLLRRAARQMEPEIMETVVSELIALHHTFADTEQNRRSFGHLLRNTLRPILDQIGFEPRVGEEPHWEPLRAELIRALGIEGDDREVIELSRKAAEAQLTQPRSMSGAFAEGVLAVATWHGDAGWAERMRAAFESAEEPDLRARFLQCLVPYSDPTISRTGLDYLLTPAVRSGEIRAIIFRPRQMGTASCMFEWVRDQYSALEDKLSKEMLPMLPGVLAQGDQDLLKAGREFFLDSIRRNRPVEVELDKASEAVELRTALRKHHGPAMSRMLSENR